MKVKLLLLLLWQWLQRIIVNDSLTATNAGKSYIGITLGVAYPMMLPTNMVVFLELGNRHVIMSTTISTTITNVPVDM